VREEREDEGFYPELVERMKNCSSMLMKQRTEQKLVNDNYPRKKTSKYSKK